MSDTSIGVLIGTFFTTLICAFLVGTFLVDFNTVADKFAIDYQAREFAARKGFERYVCTLTAKSGFNTCYGLLDKGMTVEFQCALNPDVKCELVQK